MLKITEIYKCLGHIHSYPYMHGKPLSIVRHSCVLGTVVRMEEVF